MQICSELLLLKPRKRFAVGEYQRTQQGIAGSILSLAADMRAAWYGNIGAQHLATMRDSVAKAAQVFADPAAKVRDAGNVTVLQLHLEQGAAIVRLNITPR